MRDRDDIRREVEGYSEETLSSLLGKLPAAQEFQAAHERAVRRMEAQKLLADAIILERAARVLDRERSEAGSHSSLYWLDVKETLRWLAQAKRTEAEAYAG